MLLRKPRLRIPQTQQCGAKWLGKGRGDCSPAGTGTYQTLLNLAYAGYSIPSNTHNPRWSSETVSLIRANEAMITALPKSEQGGLTFALQALLDRHESYMAESEEERRWLPACLQEL